MNVVFLVALLIGWLCAGMVNYLGDVLPRRRKLVRPFCLACESEQHGAEYWLWPGKCPECGAWRGWRTGLVFLGGLAVASFLWLDPTPRLPGWLNGLVWVYFVLIFVIDMEHRLILHVTSLAGAGLGLVVGIWLHGITATLLGGAAGFGLMLVMYWLGNVFVRLMERRKQKLEITARERAPAAETPGKSDVDPNGAPYAGSEGEPEGLPIEDALGFGDVNLAGVIGLMLGWPGVVGGLMLAIILGGAISLVYLVVSLALRRYQAFAAIPYGPFLVISVLFLLYFSKFFLTNL